MINNPLYFEHSTKMGCGLRLFLVINIIVTFQLLSVRFMISAVCLLNVLLCPKDCIVDLNIYGLISQYFRDNFNMCNVIWY